MPESGGPGEREIPDQTGRTAIVTGANSGIGFATARALVGRGAHVVLACRSLTRARRAAKTLDKLAGRSPGGRVEILPLDLADLDSVRAFAREILEQKPRLDLLFNNAGVMAVPFEQTADGFEMQIGTNHLGHFALTGLLLPLLLETPGSRIVTTASSIHRFGRLDFDDLHGQRRYNRLSAYARSKLANLLFTYELDRRLRRAGRETLSVAAHPGYAETDLPSTGPRLAGTRVLERIVRLGGRLVAQSPADACRPQLMAGCAPDVKGGEYFGPAGLLGLRGRPQRVRSHARSHDETDARRLWEISSELTDVHYGCLP